LIPSTMRQGVAFSYEVQARTRKPKSFRLLIRGLFLGCIVGALFRFFCGILTELLANIVVGRSVGLSLSLIGR
jgi:hypothetical protein